MRGTAIIPCIGPATEFTTEENSYRVESTLSTISMPTDMQLVLPAEIIDVDVNHLMDTLIEAFTNRTRHSVMCEKAVQHAQKYTWEVIGEIVAKRIQALHERPLSKTIIRQSMEEQAFHLLQNVNQRTTNHTATSATYAAILSHGLHESDVILDIGPKSADLLEFLQMKGGRVTTLALVGPYPLENKIRSLLSDEWLNHKIYDVVFMRHVIEKLQPRSAVELLLQLYKALSYRGRIFIVTPDCDNTQMITKKFWTNPFNIRPYSMELLQLLLSEVGFRTITGGKMPGGDDALIFASRLANDNPFV
ncbi:hypothetical protein GCM10025858_13390 [Alicyclobacillus sacchari]|uniref:methyltransferase domain-containing protein n=1 Tax=Alicyclobacillus sacchari TaxID=392010 RepID=UPI0023E9AAE7|nr:methyltransferase domain-containing protein [Alicyclobacillus sacchari]GMA56836.1 hypothetical protein GCM10025858_13390 [Alicyclobacillus sacchari]